MDNPYKAKGREEIMRKNIFNIFLIVIGFFLAQNINAETYAEDIIILNDSIIYSCDFEAASPCISDWVLDSPWGLTDEDSSGGTQSLTDSPGGSSYSNNYDGSAKIQIDFFTKK